MKIAILYTGEFRTIEKTLPYLYANILDTNPDTHIFATIQAPDQQLCQEILENNIPLSQLKSVQWFCKDDQTWTHIRDRLISTMNITEQWKTYLRTSGSMVEYYQLYLSYLKMVEYEQTHGVYDYVMRFRTDTVLNKPLDFSWTKKNASEIKSRMAEVKTLLKDDEITLKHIYYYMNSVFDRNRIYYLDEYYGQFIKNNHFKNDPQIQSLLSLSEPEFYKSFQEYIQNGNFLISLRKNVIYFAKREHFHFIPSLGMLYGTFHDPDPYWFNSENQFKYCCMRQKMTIFDSRTELEDKSLYEYDPANYFYGDAIRENSSFFFVLCRK